MSLWTIGLGVSVGYLIFKRGSLSAAIENQVREYEAEGDDATTEGISDRQIRKMKTLKANLRDEMFREELPPRERQALEQAEEAIEREAFEFDKGPDVLGIYLDELQYD